MATYLLANLYVEKHKRQFILFLCKNLVWHNYYSTDPRPIGNMCLLLYSLFKNYRTHTSKLQKTNFESFDLLFLVTMWRRCHSKNETVLWFFHRNYFKLLFRSETNINAQNQIKIEHFKRLKSRSKICIWLNKFSLRRHPILVRLQSDGREKLRIIPHLFKTSSIFCFYFFAQNLIFEKNKKLYSCIYDQNFKRYSPCIENYISSCLFVL